MLEGFTRIAPIYELLIYNILKLTKIDEGSVERRGNQHFRQADGWAACNLKILARIQQTCCCI